MSLPGCDGEGGVLLPGSHVGSFTQSNTATVGTSLLLSSPWLLTLAALTSSGPAAHPGACKPTVSTGPRASAHGTSLLSAPRSDMAWPQDGSSGHTLSSGARVSRTRTATRELCGGSVAICETCWFSGRRAASTCHVQVQEVSPPAGPPCSWRDRLKQMLSLGHLEASGNQTKPLPPATLGSQGAAALGCWY